MARKNQDQLTHLNQMIRQCTRCPLHHTRTHAVPGEGSLHPSLLFIGEAPGRTEDLQGKPFVGRAGKLLDELLQSIDLKRQEIFITNIVKCRPPKNRTPKRIEIKKCIEYLKKQITRMKPNLIVTLGTFASHYIFQKYHKKFLTLGNAHGTVFPVTTPSDHLSIIPLYHPAAALYNPKLKKTLLQDFQHIKQEINTFKRQTENPHHTTVKRKP